ncbi:MAG: TorF family putative porin [Pseudomonadota bacterium]|nr:TorF family putative porin [Pseudomonadota bacterium]
MKNVLGLKKTVLAASIVAAGLAPAIAAAEISGTLGASSQYLWRGQQLTDGAAVYGSVDYSHTSGLYAGAWASSETDDTEYDLYAGFGGEIEGVSYDISYIDYNYTAGGTAGDNPASGADFQEVHLGLGFAGLSADAYLGVGNAGKGGDEDYESDYFAVGYSYDKYGATVGYYDFDADDSDYTHVDLSYAVTDQFTFTLSKIVDQEEDDIYDDDLVMSVSYEFAL